MSRDIQIIGGDEAVRNIARRVGKDKVNRVVKKNTTETQQRMMRNASFNKGYQTGTTKRSISIELFPAQLAGEVKPGTEYSPYLETGTRFMEAQPFVKPTRDEQAPIFLKDMQDLIRKG